MQDLWLGVSLAELGCSSVLVDHACEESMMPDRGVEQGHRGGVVGGVEACRLAVWRWEGRWSGYCRELVLGMIVLV